MVTYSASSASRSIVISEMVYSTQLTLSAPANVAEKTAFIVSGKLTFMEGGIFYGLPGRTISIAGGGASINVVTASDGTYSAQMTIATFGTYTLTASFAGAVGLAAAEAYSYVGVTGLEGPNLGGLALIGLGLYVGYELFVKKKR